jgi:hypothetical protein
MKKLNKIKLLTLKVVLGLSSFTAVHAEMAWIKPLGTTALGHDKAVMANAFGIQNAGLVMSILLNRLAPQEASDLLQLAKEVHDAQDNLKKLEQKFTDLADEVSLTRFKALKQGLEAKLATKKEAFFSKLSVVRTKLGEKGIYNRLSVFRRNSKTAEEVATKTGFFKDKARRNVFFVLAGVAILTIDVIHQMSELDDLPEVERDVEELVTAETKLNN